MILVFSSITYALKAQKILTAASVPTELVRSPRVREVRGCGYGLKMSDKDVTAAENACAATGIKVIGKLNDINKR